MNEYMFGMKIVSFTFYVAKVFFFYFFTWSRIWILLRNSVGLWYEL